jgi:hypothetical protein
VLLNRVYQVLPPGLGWHDSDRNLRKWLANVAVCRRVDCRFQSRNLCLAGYALEAEWMTRAQDSYLHTLARKPGEEVDKEVSKAEASIKINDLREKTGLENPLPKGRQIRRK